MGDIYEQEQETATATDGGWEAPHANGSVGTSGKVCVRHRYKGGDGVHCVNCGQAKETRAASIARTVGGRTAKAGVLEMPISLAWMGLGWGIEKQNKVLSEPRKLLADGEGEATGIPVSVAVGRTFKMEATVAGKRIDKALRGTPFYRAVAPWFDMAGGLVDVGALFAPPLLVGLAALRPEVVAENPTIRAIMVGTLIPILVEQAKMAERQAELLTKLEGADAATIEQANAIVDSLLGVNGAKRQ